MPYSWNFVRDYKMTPPFFRRLIRKKISVLYSSKYSIYNYIYKKTKTKDMTITCTNLNDTDFKMHQYICITGLPQFLTSMECTHAQSTKLNTKLKHGAMWRMAYFGKYIKIHDTVFFQLIIKHLYHIGKF
jgi:hypothetical protein